MQKNIFIIGLGGSGKSKIGSLLAKRMGRSFIDLDDEFRNSYGDIGVYVDTHGSETYGSLNSRLFDDLLGRHRERAVFVLPPGFVVDKTTGINEMTERHLSLMRQNGTTILILPSSNYAECLCILLERQLKRGLGYTEEGIREDISVRFTRFMELGDVKIFSKDTPNDIVTNIIDRLASAMTY